MHYCFECKFILSLETSLVFHREMKYAQPHNLGFSLLAICPKETLQTHLSSIDEDIYISSIAHNSPKLETPPNGITDQLRYVHSNARQQETLNSLQDGWFTKNYLDCIKLINYKVIRFR